MKKKTDFKKLAMLGIAAGSMVSTGASADLFNNTAGNLLAYGCGGQHGCGGAPVNNGNTTQNGGYYQAPTQQAPQAAQPTQPNGQPGQPQVQQQVQQQAQQVKEQVAYNGCGGYRGTQGYSYGGQQYQQYQQSPQQSYYGYQGQPQNSCNGQYQQNYTSYQPQASHGCGGAAQRPQTSYANTQPQASHGCGGAAQRPQTTYANTQPQASHGCGGAAPKLQAYNAPRATNAGAPASGTNNTADNAPTQWEQPGQSQGGRQSAYQAPARNTNNYTAEAAVATPKVSRPQLNESQLVQQLNPEAKTTFQSLDPAGKALALKLVNMTCKGTNDCKGLNACNTPTNSCAGNGGCKGQSPQAFQDINSAVKVAAKKMAEKRSAA